MNQPKHAQTVLYSELEKQKIIQKDSIILGSGHPHGPTPINHKSCTPDLKNIRRIGHIAPRAEPARPDPGSHWLLSLGIPGPRPRQSLARQSGPTLPSLPKRECMRTPTRLPFEDMFYTPKMGNKIPNNLFSPMTLPGMGQKKESCWGKCLKSPF
jgi:hypothetical protein